MKKYILIICLAILSSTVVFAQKTYDEMLNKNIRWTFDGDKLVLINTTKKHEEVEMPDFNDKNPAPWRKKKLKIRRLEIDEGIISIGSQAFFEQTSLTEVLFRSTYFKSIGLAAFYGCKNLRTISLPQNLQLISAAAFAKCTGLTAISIPAGCVVEEQAFKSCSGLTQISISPQVASLGMHIFTCEIINGNSVNQVPCKAKIIEVPNYINEANCTDYGISVEQMKKYGNNNHTETANYDKKTSTVDENIPSADRARYDTYALIIGNQEYRSASEVPYAIHDSRIFKEYCNKTLGIPAQNIHHIENATKMMIWDEEMDWLSSLPERENKKLIVYYAGHGVPDTKKANKAYLLPTDVKGATPQYGIAMDDFYARIGSMNFDQCSVFLDACFSGISRKSEGVVPGTRAVEVTAEEGDISNGNMIVFSAAQGNETAQGLDKEGHGLFTYYLLKQLQETAGKSNFGKLSDYIEENVTRAAITETTFKKSQTPTTRSCGTLSDNWKKATF